MAEGADRAKGLAGGIARIGPGLRAPGAAFGLDEGFQPLALQPLAKSAGRKVVAAGPAQGGSEFGEARLVILAAEDELDDGSHWRPGLGLEAGIVEQFGIAFLVR